jgi:PAS domain S-box-containing protein
MTDKHSLTGTEKTFDTDEVIVTKTDVKGLITYANRTFLRVSEYTEDDVLGKPHCMIRHPEMPRCMFKMLWDTLTDGTEMFAYVINRTRLGNHYWVLAHVTPSFDSARRVVGFHSNRRVPDRSVLENTIIPLYRNLTTLERTASDPAVGLAASSAALNTLLQDKGVSYDRYIFSL